MSFFWAGVSSQLRLNHKPINFKAQGQKLLAFLRRNIVA